MSLAPIIGNPITLARRSGGSGPSAEDAVLLVTVPAGATVTAIKDNQSLTPARWTQADDATKETAMFVVPPALFDAATPWTVDVTRGLETGSDTVIIDSNFVYSLSPVVRLVLIRDGLFATGVTWELFGPDAATLTEHADGYVDLLSPAATGTFTTCRFAQIDRPIYKYLVIDAQARGFYNAECPAVGVLRSVNSGSNYSTFAVKRTFLSGTTNSLTRRSTTRLNVSGQTSAYYIGMQEAGSGANNAVGEIRCYNLYLTNEET